jgi:RsiW-degrading membrane proteinase PrsW (M82 family)
VIATAVLMVGFYYASTHAQSTVSWVAYVIFVNGILNVLFPAYFVPVVRREGLNQLGITSREGVNSTSQTINSPAKVYHLCCKASD